MKNKVTVVIPTRNRLKTLKEVIQSYINQKDVKEILIIDDFSDQPIENTDFSLALKEANNPSITLRVINNEKREGAAKSRNKGIKNAQSEYILFGEDDAYIDDDYVKNLINKITNDKSIGAISGQIIYLEPEENKHSAKTRFLEKPISVDPFDTDMFTINHSNPFSHDQNVPYTHALFLSKRSDLLKYPFDDKFVFGNGYREESTSQVKMFINGLHIVVTPSTYCYHFHRIDVPSGGQRTNHFHRIISILTNNYFFYSKYYRKIAIKKQLSRNIISANFLFIWKFMMSVYVYPLFRKIFK